ncbi:MAG: class I adenylate-forming enzyme family protein [Actinomycetota bacterium]
MLPQVIERAARDHADAVAYRTHTGWDVSYADLDRLSDEAAAWLAMRGIDEGDVVALCLPSRVDYVVAYLASAKVGAVTAGVNPRFTARERAAALDTLVPDLVLAAGDDQLEGVPSDAEVELITLADQPEEILASERIIGEAPALLAPDPARPVAVCFTSGSSGEPKGAWYENRQLQAIADLDTGGSWGGGGHRYASTEFAHVGVMTKLPWLLASGGTTHLLKKWRAEPILELIDRYRMGAVAAIAPQVALMLRVPDLDRFDFDCVKAIVTGGALASPGLVAAGRELFGAPWSIRYSSTESGGVGLGTALDADDEEALHTVGRPRPGVEAEIRGSDGSPVDHGEVGELWLRSAAVMSGYWNDPENTARTLVDGWLRTGDLAHVDDRGCFRLAGRTTEMFIRGGYNVYPLEVEAVLSTHPKVASVAVAPRPDAVMGEIGVAVVVPVDPGDPPTLDELRRHAESGLATYKLPEAIRLSVRLPTNATDKVDRRSLVATEQAEYGTHG